MALAEAGNRVTLAYRRSAFSRIKAGNHERIRQLADARRITLLFDTTVVHISETEVELDVGGQRRRLPNALVFAMIGRELPYAFFERIGIAIEKTWTLTRFALYGLAVFIFTSIYFGKHVVASRVLQEGEPVRRYSEWLVPAIIVAGMIGVVYVVYLRLNRGKLDTFRAYVGPTAVLIVTLGASLGALWWMSGQSDANFLWGRHPGFWYSLLYTVTIFIFGLRRMRRKQVGWLHRPSDPQPGAHPSGAPVSYPGAVTGHCPSRLDSGLDRGARPFRMGITGGGMDLSWRIPCSFTMC
ncbi:hypothetical protein J8C07_13825 [Chloracidobacterium sp. S]|uniref:hypothetical protein n=1 Tax=Chloracidobacterium aggregatum TaxID=2851959 RepID=UPI001B8D1E27|nr:hypothetical protein [Chloracidobacterium aggregatum]QUV89728.1 hypothetical protein J8C07_13825 [Chloracidobacterium sp. S]